VTPRSRVPVWLPLLAVLLGIAVMICTTVVVGMWILAGLALAEAIARGLGREGATVRVRSRGIDVAILASFALLLAILASSGVLD
jgi:hypothetical protein